MLHEHVTGISLVNRDFTPEWTSGRIGRVVAGKKMSLNCEILVVVLHILTVLAIRSFLRDQKSHYLKGLLCVLVYIIAVLTTWYDPNSNVVTDASITSPTQ